MRSPTLPIPVMKLVSTAEFISGAGLIVCASSASTSDTESTTAPTTRPLTFSTITTVKLLYSAVSQPSFRRRSTIGTMTPREDLLRFLDAVPEHVLTVIDEAYFQYVEDPSFPDAIEEAAKRGRNVLALRTFSKIFGLAGLRIGYGVGPAGVVSAMRKVQRAFDVTTPAQEAALASLDDDAELERRRAVNRDAMAALEAVLREHGFDPISPAVGNFLFVDVGEDAAALDQRLLRRGVIVRPMGSFGAPSALRITAGTPEEIAFLAEQLDAVLVPEAGRIPVS